MPRYLKAYLPPLLLCFPILPDDGRPPSYASSHTWLPTSDSVFKTAESVGLRCLRNVGSSGTVALANPVASHIMTSTERGTYSSWGLRHRRSRHPLAPLLGVFWRGILDGVPSFSFFWRWRASWLFPWSSSSQKRAANSSATARFLPQLKRVLYECPAPTECAAARQRRAVYEQHNELASTRGVRIVRTLAALATTVALVFCHKL